MGLAKDTCVSARDAFYNCDFNSPFLLIIFIVSPIMQS